MKRNCKSCKNFKDCDLKKFLPFPQAGCSDFKNRSLCLFAVIFCNTETGVKNVLNIFDDIDLANAEKKRLIEEICKCSSTDISVYVRPCPYIEAKELADKILINIVNIVSFDLSVAERGFKNGSFKQDTFNKSQKWFDFVHSACRRGGAILDVILND